MNFWSFIGDWGINSTGCEGARGEKIGAKQIYVDLGPNIPKWSEYKGILITSNPKAICDPET